MPIGSEALERSGLRGAPPAGMVRIPEGSFDMGSNDFYPEERPVRRRHVASFWMDRCPVTNAAFARFVRATGYVTLAERAPDPSHYPGVAPSVLVAGSLVFTPPTLRVPLDDPQAWWTYVPGASWRHPSGPGSTVVGREAHPVVHVAFEDAMAYAQWRGKDLPTEAEWEFAARGGLSGARYAWGDEREPDGRRMANTWLGEFPWLDLKPPSARGTSRVGGFPANGYGLRDMVGNVWEWTQDVARAGPESGPGGGCCHGSEAAPLVARVLKGGSYLCAPNHCARDRPAARQPLSADSASCHVGFRCVLREDARSQAGARGG